MKPTKMLDRALNQANTGTLFEQPDNNVIIPEKSPEQPKNKKIKNAKKIEYNGITFDSGLEKNLYIMLQEAGVFFIMKPRIELIEGFEYRGEKYRPIAIEPDFYLPEHDCYIDSKGWMLREGAMKYKLFKWYLAAEHRTSRIEMPRNKKECATLIHQLQNGFTLDKPLSDGLKKARRKQLTKAGWHQSAARHGWEDTYWSGTPNAPLYYTDAYLMNLQKYEFEQLINKP